MISEPHQDHNCIPSDDKLNERPHGDVSHINTQRPTTETSVEKEP